MQNRSPKLVLGLLLGVILGAFTALPAWSFQTQDKTTSPSRRAILREGTELLRVSGTMERKGPGTPWEFVVGSKNADQPEFRFTLLPSRTLEEMETVTEEHPDKQIEFVMSGDLYVYRNKNYLHPTHAAYRVKNSTKAEGAASSVDATSASTQTPTKGEDETTEAPPEGQESIDDLLAKFEERTGPLTRSLNRDQPESARETDIPEGSLMHMRRGRLTRDADGAWVFIFDADSEGLGDPPVTLLPSLTLYSLENTIDQTGPATPLLLSGEIVLYRDQRFLIPTMFRSPTQRTHMNP